MLSSKKIRPIKPFKVESKYKPAGDQPNAISGMVEGLENGLASQTLLGVTGSGKTFSIANVIEQVQRPTIVLAHNKTCLLYTSPSPRDGLLSRMPSSA